MPNHAATPNPDQGTILPRVQELLTRIPYQNERVRYERFFRSASVAIERMGEMDVSSSDPETDNPSAIWSRLTPVVDETLQSVAFFLEVVEAEFPIAEVETQTTVDAAFDEAFGPSAPPPKPTAPSDDPEDTSQQAAVTLQALCANLAHELKGLRASLSKPSVMSDRWHLLERLAEFRGRSRSAIGEMVFVAARLFAVVRKEDVVPFYKEDVDASLALRSGITSLRQKISVNCVRLDRVDVSANEAATRQCLEDFIRNIGGFMKTAVFAAMRATDKRSFLEVRKDLETLVSEKSLNSKEVKRAAEGLARFLDSLSLINRRELVLVHDQETIEEIERHLSAVSAGMADGDVESARSCLNRSLDAASKLKGRESTFDMLIKLCECVTPEAIPQEDLLALAQLIQRQL